MNALSPFDSVELWQLAGWTMIHFLWLGTVAAAAALLCRVWLRSSTANLRYAAALGCLLLLAAMPIGIAAWLVGSSPPLQRTAADMAPALLQGDTAGGLARASEKTAPDDAAEQPIIELTDAAASTSPPVAFAEDNRVEVSPTSATPFSDTSSLATSRMWTALQQFVPYLPWLWLLGTPITFGLLAVGLIGTKRLRQASRAIEDSEIAELFKRVAASLRIRTRVGISVCDRIAAPVLIGIIRPMILLPPAAITGWTPDEIEMVLLHELAHVRRWDNLVNLFQRCIESLLFFHPAVWLVSSWVRREREACCDAIVVGRTRRPHAYAELLVALAAQMPRSVLFHPAASSAMAAGPLRMRIRRILQLENDPMLISGKSLAITFAGLLTAATLAVLYLPTIGQAEESATEAAESTNANHSTIEGESTDNSKTPTTSELPYAVRFEEGASRFLDGDKITVLDVRGTAQTFEPGNVYRIKGTYRLGSREQAKLSAFTTARKAADGTDPIWQIQTTRVNRGEGNFTLFLPMSHEGWPHISFYPVDGGNGFGGTYFGTGDSALKKWWRADELTEQPSASTVADTRASRFPSLEDQKLADLAFKRLQLELEPIGGEELKRVKALGYDGGVKTTPSFNGSIRDGDILVGLHVWPTTNLKEIADILRREDLAELNPLKFYVVRLGQPQSGGFIDAPEEDTVVTGRISVRFDDKTPLQSNASPSQPKASAATADTAQGFFTWQPAAERNIKAVDATVPPYVLPSPDNEATIPPAARAKNSEGELNRSPKTRRVAQTAGITANKESLRYDGKTFGDWRNLWKNELSDEKRKEAVKALAAFGRAGFEKEATETILDVAGNYDFFLATGDPEGNLKNAVFGALLPDSGNQDLVKYWAPDLATRFKKDPDRWAGLTWGLLTRLRTDDPSILAIVQSLAGSGPIDVRSAALVVLIRAGKSQDGKLVIDEKTHDLLRSALSGDDPVLTRSVLRELVYYHPTTPGKPLQPKLIFQPELVPLLFNPDDGLQRDVRGYLQYIEEKDSPAVVEQLVAVLKDDSRKNDRIAAIRALAAMGDKAKAAVPALRKLFNSSADKETLFALYVSLEAITREENNRQQIRFGIETLTEGLNENDAKVIHDRMNVDLQEFMINISKESQMVSQPDQQLGGGSGFY